jgi:quercetin dioxygenase-like cupin family protein
MLKTTPFIFGKLQGAIYDFEKKDDVLPMHEHDEQSVHITIVAKGSFKAHGVDWEKMLVNGNVVDWQPFQPHEFISLEDNSRIVNINKAV